MDQRSMKPDADSPSLRAAISNRSSRSLSRPKILFVRGATIPTAFRRSSLNDRKNFPRYRSGIVHGVSGIVHGASGTVHGASGIVHSASGIVHGASGIVHGVS